VTAYSPDRQPVGITINSLTSVSLKPPLVLFCLEKSAHIYGVFKKTKYFTVNILGEEQEDISRHFADYRRNPPPPQLWDKPQNNCPILRGTLGWMVCKKTATYKGGDHTIYLGEAIALSKRSGKREPLLYFHGKYKRIKG
jgi:flavin reductase (DIM6/NTAB) family NADH-FMN oxidoreductase RutF